ncbi:MAG: signal peptidase I [Oscillospiraceae bacterium]|nr:signal peptidase I [Oscillospiraceae bacterium]
MDEFNTSPQVPFRGLYDWMQSIVMVFLAVIFLLTFVGQTMAVQQESMTPTLLEGDRMIVRSIFYTPERGDVVIFARHDFEDGAALVKRVIALAGDTVAIDTAAGIVYVNGIAQPDDFTNTPTNMGGDMPPYPAALTVPPGHVFVIGDNRNHSMDSRHTVIGPVDEREIIGQVVAVIMPFNRAGFLSD